MDTAHHTHLQGNEENPALVLSNVHNRISARDVVGSLKMNTTLEYSTRVVQEGDRRCKKSTLNDLAYLTPLRIPLMNPVMVPCSALRAPP